MNAPLGFYSQRLFSALSFAFVLAFGVTWFPTQPLAAQQSFYSLPESPHQRNDVLVHIPVKASDSATGTKLIQLSNGTTITGQLSGPWLLDDPKEKTWITCVVPAVEAEQKIEFSWAEGTATDKRASYHWSEDGKDLMLDDHPVLQLEDQTFDNSSPEKRDLTYKVFHHVFMPGIEGPITKGPGGLFPHHRGLFYGFNRIGLEIDGKTEMIDTWHAKKAHQASAGKPSVEAGPIFARQTIQIDWICEVSSDRVFATETREIVLFRSGKQQGIQFSSRLDSKAGDVSMKGDPQHAGFQFRASQEVADNTKEQTYYLRPDGIAQPGQFRNWPDQKDHIDLPFHGMSFVVGGQRLTCLRLDRPQNPHPARFSERDYGRFGSYFEYELNEDHPLEVKYQLRFVPGELELPAAEAISAGFAG